MEVVAGKEEEAAVPEEKEARAVQEEVRKAAPLRVKAPRNLSQIHDIRTRLSLTRTRARAPHLRTQTAAGSLRYCLAVSSLDVCQGEVRGYVSKRNFTNQTV